MALCKLAELVTLELYWQLRSLDVGYFAPRDALTL